MTPEVKKRMRLIKDYLKEEYGATDVTFFTFEGKTPVTVIVDDIPPKEIK